MDEPSATWQAAFLVTGAGQGQKPLSSMNTVGINSRNPSRKRIIISGSTHLNHFS